MTIYVLAVKRRHIALENLEPLGSERFGDSASLNTAQLLERQTHGVHVLRVRTRVGSARRAQSGQLLQSRRQANCQFTPDLKHRL